MYCLLVHNVTATRQENATKASTQLAYETTVNALTVTVADGLVYQISEESVTPGKHELPSSTEKKAGRGIRPASSTDYAGYANVTTMTVTVGSECIQSTEIGGEVTIAACERNVPPNGTS
jgi:hypothetical protein